MRYNEFAVLITFTKDARNDHLAFEDKPARVLSFIWLLSLSFLVFLEFVGSLALFYFVVFQHFQSMLDFVRGLCMMELRRILAEWLGNF